MALGPAGELIRVAGIHAERRRPDIVAALRQSLAELQQPDQNRSTSAKPSPGSSGRARREPDHEQGARRDRDVALCASSHLPPE